MIVPTDTLKYLLYRANPWTSTGKKYERDNITDQEASWLGAQIVFGKKTNKGIHQEYKIPLRTVQRWSHKISIGKLVSTDPGRDRYLTAEDKEVIKEFLKPDSFNKSAEEFREFVQSLVDERLEALGTSSTEVSDRFLSKLEDELCINSGEAEETTDARAAAVADKKNSYTFAALNTLISKIVKRPLTMNADATQFTVGHDMNKKVKVKFIEKLNGRPLKVLPSKVTASLLSSITCLLLLKVIKRIPFISLLTIKWMKMKLIYMKSSSSR
jgi:hypothetical protein